MKPLKPVKRSKRPTHATSRSASRGGVRISSGRWKGRALPVPAGARPTSGRARQALFDMLGDRVAGARVLELYAGSGAVGLEAVSRAADSVVLVEPDAAALRRALEKWAVTRDEVRVLDSRAADALARLAREESRFDLVFADPPYADASVAEELRGLAGVLAEGGVVVIQTDAGCAAPLPPGLTRVSSRTYGRNVFHFLGVFDAAPGKC